ncbi:maturation of 5S rRNA [Recurvomyces mirabilis]|uniref:Maturation of 5S rRNA n=1 Tax=Recurvomyces mirabilis TaxID=574656 RepID=A0AAE0WVA3_9PEZI|nr:maturation of 5S rRNA [Recurvomyces mirabilis]KAK5161235.1 maturation of 5S rRNA [Recurvomyces mirabilis]
MLAPLILVFYAADWSLINVLNKPVNFAGDASAFPSSLCKITGIAIKCFHRIDYIEQASTAEKLSWASGRTTTRVEDEAYCLLGLLDFNMPLLYGEGRKAFLRMQKSLLESSDDDSIFAWRATADQCLRAPMEGGDGGVRIERLTPGLLARSPADFGACADIALLHERSFSRGYVYALKLDCGVRPPDFMNGQLRSAIALWCLDREGPSGALMATHRCAIDENDLYEIFDGYIGTPGSTPATDSGVVEHVVSERGFPESQLRRPKKTTRRLFITL